MIWITIGVAALGLWILASGAIAIYQWPPSLAAKIPGGCYCDHPPHPPGSCEALDGGCNPHAYCWCPEKEAAILRGGTAVRAMLDDLERLGIGGNSR